MSMKNSNKIHATKTFPRKIALNSMEIQFTAMLDVLELQISFFIFSSPSIAMEKNHKWKTSTTANSIFRER